MPPQVVREKILKKIYKPRPKDSHKYDFGSLLVIGGSKLYHGSPLFAALAAYRSGVDLVTIAAPHRVADIIASYAPDLITYPLGGDYVSGRHLKTLFELSRSKTAIVIGGGLGRERETIDTVRKYLEETELPCVIDADAIYAIAREPRLLKNNFLITPHLQEFFVLTGKKADGLDMAKKIKVVKEESINSTILLKGNIDIISNGKQTAINKTGNPFMTKGGTGDILAGVCGSLLAQGIGLFDSACAAAYINGKAGDLAARKRKQSLMASELVDNICNAIGCE
jgi:hydroxyethylthiazole kinase-like uncharacterized protein yjeF